MEIIRYTAVGKEDLNLGIGTFEVRLADGRVVTLSKIDIGALLNDSANSTQNLSLGTLTITGLTVSGTLTLGAVTVTSVLDLTSGGITFPSVQVASSDVYTLDDYREVDWTPSVGGNASYTSRSGKAIKIGGLVFVRCAMQIATLGTGSDSSISGLPAEWTVTGNCPLKVGQQGPLALSVVEVGAIAIGGTNNIQLYSRRVAGADFTTNGILGDGCLIEIGGCYTVI